MKKAGEDFMKQMAQQGGGPPKPAPTAASVV